MTAKKEFQNDLTNLIQHGNDRRYSVRSIDWLRNDLTDNFSGRKETE